MTFGEPFCTSELRRDLAALDEPSRRKAIADVVQAKLFGLGGVSPLSPDLAEPPSAGGGIMSK